MNGQVVRLVKSRGFGFIRGESGDEFFFHLDNLLDLTFEELVKELDEGKRTKVAFNLVQTHKGTHAINITRV